MTLIKKILLISLLIVLSSYIVHGTSFAGDFILDGFRGIKWGDNPNKLGASKVLIGEIGGEISYIKKNDQMSFYGLKTGLPIYTFSSYGFIHAHAKFYGLEKYEDFLNLFSKNGIVLTDISDDVFGNTIDGTRLKYIKMHLVETKITGISLELYSDSTGSITVYSNSR